MKNMLNKLIFIVIFCFINLNGSHFKILEKDITNIKKTYNIMVAKNKINKKYIKNIESKIKYIEILLKETKRIDNKYKYLSNLETILLTVNNLLETIEKLN